MGCFSLPPLSRHSGLPSPSRPRTDAALVGFLIAKRYGLAVLVLMGLGAMLALAALVGTSLLVLLGGLLLSVGGASWPDASGGACGMPSPDSTSGALTPLSGAVFVCERTVRALRTTL